jgi:small GTP-binding protein
MAKVIETDRNRIELQFWDTAGQELFRSVTRGYYRNATVAYLVFDLSRRRTFTSLDVWLTDIREIADRDLILVLIGNKSDLVDTREVTSDEAESYARTNRAAYFETSAKTAEQVSTALLSVMAALDAKATKLKSDGGMKTDSLLDNAESSDGSCC